VALSQTHHVLISSKERHLGFSQGMKIQVEAFRGVMRRHNSEDLDLNSSREVSRFDVSATWTLIPQAYIGELRTGTV